MFDFVRKTVVCIAAVSFMVQVSVAANNTNDDPPNIILIHADDLGFFAPSFVS
jgi:hypothetical protein